MLFPCPTLLNRRSRNHRWNNHWLYFCTQYLFQNYLFKIAKVQKIWLCWPCWRVIGWKKEINEGKLVFEMLQPFNKVLIILLLLWHCLFHIVSSFSSLTTHIICTLNTYRFLSSCQFILISYQEPEPKHGNREESGRQLLVELMEGVEGGRDIIDVPNRSGADISTVHLRRTWEYQH